MLPFANISFVTSAHALKQLPAPEHPEIAFAGRSNVGKSTLLNRLCNRRNLVKVSARPGKTQSLNYFLVDDSLYLVDLPGYGYAKVPKGMQHGWQELITSYLSTRSTLRCVVVLVDIRHELKASDLQLVDWLRHQGRSYLMVYTKADKLSANDRLKQRAALDAGFSASDRNRVVFSGKTGDGRTELLELLDTFL